MRNIKTVSTNRIVVSPKIHSSGYQTVVVSSSDSSEPSITINARVFGPERLAFFLDFLASRGASVERT